MKIILKAAFERDVDLVLVRAFCEENSAAQLFLNHGDEILEVHHSAMELHGESDLQIIVKRNGSRHAILIEDKVDAPAQPNQHQRYCERGDRGKAEGRWKTYTVFIAAPQKYLESDREAAKYPHKVSYEAIRDKLIDPLSIAIIETALKKSEGILPPVVDEAVTAFWEAYYEYHEEHMSHLALHINHREKGPNATWPDFKTILKDAKILHKSERGVVDLQFRGMGDDLEPLKVELTPYLAPDMKIEKAGNSAVVRIKVPIMDFSKAFSNYQNQIATVFSAIERLNQLALTIHTQRQLSEMAEIDNTDDVNRKIAYYHAPTPCM